MGQPVRAHTKQQWKGRQHEPQPIYPLRLYLIRHGETEWALAGQHTGRTDIPLTQNGEDEARALGPHLRATRFAHVLTSPLQRASQTCALAALAQAPDIEPDLVEWDYGDPVPTTGSLWHPIE